MVYNQKIIYYTQTNTRMDARACKVWLHVHFIIRLLLQVFDFPFSGRRVRIYLGIYTEYTDGRTHIHSSKQRTVNNTVSGVLTQRTTRRHFPEATIFFFTELQHSNPVHGHQFILTLVFYSVCLCVCV